MNRNCVLVLAILLAAAASAPAQEWARKMFKTTKHDFGTVARGSKEQFAFVFKNIYKEEVHIAGTRTSCGCTSVKVTKDRLKTYETGEVIAIFNTHSYLGARGATITVIFDEPYYAEVQLTVEGYIRSDVVFTPGIADFGAVQAGEVAETTVNVAYAGRDDWEIVDVRSAHDFYEVELEEIGRGGGRVTYRMLVRLKATAPVGYIQDQLTIVTNDAGARTVSLPVEGRVTSPLTVSPASLFLGVLKPGETAKRRLVVRGSKPFHIVGVKCRDRAFSFDVPSGDAKALHFVPVQYKAGQHVGKVIEKIEIETDLPGGLKAECTATATITP